MFQSTTARERRYVRQLIKLGCPRSNAQKLGAMQRKVWEQQEAAEQERTRLRLAIKKALDANPEFHAAVQKLGAERSKSD